jgi:hypothetical protein
MPGLPSDVSCPVISLGAMSAPTVIHGHCITSLWWRWKLKWRRCKLKCFWLLTCRRFCWTGICDLNCDWRQGFDRTLRLGQCFLDLPSGLYSLIENAGFSTAAA